jgi:hypothetical protein
VAAHALPGSWSSTHRRVCSEKVQPGDDGDVTAARGRVPQPGTPVRPAPERRPSPTAACPPRPTRTRAQASSEGGYSPRLASSSPAALAAPALRDLAAPGAGERRKSAPDRPRGLGEPSAGRGGADPGAPQELAGARGGGGACAAGAARPGPAGRELCCC